MTGMVQCSGREQALRQLARFVSGDGIELGPGHQPFPLSLPGATARYVDRWKPDENQELFPEIDNDAIFPQPDIIADLNTERLTMLDDASEDFVIASHVLEHLVDPLAQLAEIHRVLRPGGLALILLPDRRLTFDRARQATTLDHLVADHAAGITVADDAHIEEFLIYTEGWHESHDDPASRKTRFDLQRDRSFHVHCWTQEEFLPVLRHTMSEMSMCWELLDALFVEDVTDSIEFGFVLRRCLQSVEPTVLADRLDATWETLVDSRRGAGTSPWLVALNQSPAYRRARRLARPAKQVGKSLVAKVRPASTSSD